MALFLCQGYWHKGQSKAYIVVHLIELWVTGGLKAYIAVHLIELRGTGKSKAKNNGYWGNKKAGTEPALKGGGAESSCSIRDTRQTLFTGLSSRFITAWIVSFTSGETSAAN